MERDRNNEEAARDRLMEGQGRCASARKCSLLREKPNGGEEGKARRGEEE